MEPLPPLASQSEQNNGTSAILFSKFLNIILANFQNTLPFLLGLGLGLGLGLRLGLRIKVRIKVRD